MLKKKMIYRLLATVLALICVGSLSSRAVSQGNGTGPVGTTATCDYNVPAANTSALITAMTAANANLIAETICLGGGTYRINGINNTVFITPPGGSSAEANHNGLPVVAGVLTIEGGGATLLASPPTTSTNYRVFHVAQTGDLRLNGLNFASAAVSGSRLSYIYPIGRLAINDSTFTGNQAEGVLIPSGSTAELTNVTFQNIYRAVTNIGTLTVTGGSFIGATGSAIENRAIANIDGTLFSGNSSATSGGAIYNSRLLNVTNARFIDNAAAQSGGAIFTVGLDATVTGSVFRGNRVTSAQDGQGSVIYAHTYASFSITQSCIVDNQTLNPNGTDLWMVNSTTSTAANNWWGTADGPSGGAPGSGDSIRAGIAYSPFLTAPIRECTPAPLAALGQSVSARAGAPSYIDLTATGGIPAYGYTVTSAPAHGTFTGSGASWVYTPAVGYTGTDSFTFQVTDSANATSTSVVQMFIDVPPPATITVTTTAQEYPPVANAACSLSEAIMAANTNAPVGGCPAGSATRTDVIELIPNTYTLNTNAIELTYDRTGLPYIESDILINGRGSSVRRGDTRTFRLLRVNLGARLTLFDLTLTGGFIDFSGQSGGAVQAFGPLTLNRVQVASNGALRSYGSRNGGSVGMVGPARLSVYGGTFSSNTGGAIVGDSGPVMIVGTQFNDNLDGVLFASTLDLHNVVINNTPDGPAVSGQQVTIRDSTISNTSTAGGAVWITNGNLTMTRTTIQGTRLENYGGAIYIFGSTAEITDSQILDTSWATPLASAAGIYIQDNMGTFGTVRSTQVTVSRTCFVGNMRGIQHGSEGMLNAAHNWWGASDGPLGFGGGGDPLSVYLLQNVTYQPFLTSDPADCGSLPPIATGSAVDVVYETASPVPLTIYGGVAPYTVEIVTPPTHGTLTGAQSPLTYTPENGFNGEDNFTFVARDAAGKVSNTATQSLRIVSSLASPNRTIDTYTFPLEFTLTATGGVLPLTLTAPASVSFGTVTGNGPTFIFTPNETFSGEGVIVFEVRDSAGFVVNPTVTIRKFEPLSVVSPVRQYVLPGLPSSVALPFSGGIPPLTYSYSTPQYGTLTGSRPDALTYTYSAASSQPETITVTITASDGASIQGVLDLFPGTPLQGVAQNLPTPFNTALSGLLSAQGGTAPFSYAIAQPPLNGAITGTLPAFTYTPQLDFEGLDFFDFRVTDANGVSAVARVTVDVEPRFRLRDGDFTIRYETPREVFLTVNDNRDPYTYSVVTPPAHGTLSGALDTQTRGIVRLLYTPNAGYVGPDSFQVRAQNADGLVSIGTATLTVRGFTSVAAGDSAGLIAAIVAANADPGPDTIILAGGIYTLTGPYAEPAQNGSGLPIITDELEIRGAVDGVVIARAADAPFFRILTNRADGSMLRRLTLSGGQAPTNAFGGNLLNERSMTLQNVTLQNASAYLGGGLYNSNTIEIIDSRIVNNRAGYRGGLVFNAGELSARDSIFAGGSGVRGTAFVNTRMLTVTMSCILGGESGGTIDLDPSSTNMLAGNWWGNPDPSSEGITVANPLPTAILGCPTATNQTVYGAFNTPLPVSLSAAGTAPLSYVISRLPNSATISGISPNIVYNPYATFSGADDFQYRVIDANGLSARGTIRVTIALDLTTVSQMMSGGINQPRPFTLNASGGRTPYAYTVTGGPQHGTISGTAPNLVYTPNLDYTGTETISYTVTDANGDTATGTVTITVAALTASNQNLTTAYGAPLPVTLMVSGGNTPYQIVASPPTHGTFLGADHTWTYVPPVGFIGTDVVVYQVTDASGAQITGTIGVTVGAPAPATITVNSTAFEMPLVTNGNCTLAEAITAANDDHPVDACAAGAGVDVIDVPAGLYAITGFAVPVSEEGMPSITSEMTIRGAGRDQTILEPTLSMFIFTNRGRLTLEALSIRNNIRTDSTLRGASVTNHRDLILRDVRFEGNAARRGGAVYTSLDYTGQGPGPTVQVVNSQFIDNFSIDGLGGALYSEVDSTLEVYNSLFEGNQAQINGSAIWWVGPARVQGSCFLSVPQETSSVVFKGFPVNPPYPPPLDGRFNWWEADGATIRATNATTTPTLATRPTICGSTTPPPLTIPAGDVDALAAAIRYANTQTSPTTITLAAHSLYVLTREYAQASIGTKAFLPGIRGQVTIAGNGSALIPGTTVPTRFFTLYAGANLTLSDLLVAHGRGNPGGAIYLNSSRLTIRDSAFIDNGPTGLSSAVGGAIYAAGSVVDITTTFFDGNRALQGGAIHATGTLLTLQNSRFTRNQATVGSSIVVSGYQSGETASDNCFVGNIGPSVSRMNDFGQDVVARFGNNWWGSPDGPSGAGPGTGDAVSTFVTYAPFLSAAPPCADGARFMAALQVTVEFQGRPAAPHISRAVPAQVKLSSVQGTTVFDQTIPLDQYGSFTTGGLLPGRYILQVKVDGGLTTSQIVWLNPGANTIGTLARAGDANGDDRVDMLDFQGMALAFGASAGDPTFNPSVDFNWNGWIDVIDFSLLASNFGVGG